MYYTKITEYIDKLNIMLKLQNKTSNDIRVNFRDSYFDYLMNVLKIIYYINIRHNESGYYNELFFYRTVNDKNTKFMLCVDCEGHIMIKIKQYLDDNHIIYKNYGSMIYIYIIITNINL